MTTHEPTLRVGDGGTGTRQSRGSSATALGRTGGRRCEGMGIAEIQTLEHAAHPHQITRG